MPMQTTATTTATARKLGSRAAMTVAGRRRSTSQTKRKGTTRQGAQPPTSPMQILHQVLVNRTLSRVAEEEPEPQRSVPFKSPPQNLRQPRSKPYGKKATVRQRHGPRFQPRAHGSNH